MMSNNTLSPMGGGGILKAGKTPSTEVSCIGLFRDCGSLSLPDMNGPMVYSLDMAFVNFYIAKVLRNTLDFPNCTSAIAVFADAYISILTHFNISQNAILTQAFQNSSISELPESFDPHGKCDQIFVGCENSRKFLFPSRTEPGLIISGIQYYREIYTFNGTDYYSAFLNSGMGFSHIYDKDYLWFHMNFPDATTLSYMFQGDQIIQGMLDISNPYSSCIIDAPKATEIMSFFGNTAGVGVSNIIGSTLEIQAPLIASFSKLDQLCYSQRFRSVRIAANLYNADTTPDSLHSIIDSSKNVLEWWIVRDQPMYNEVGIKNDLYKVLTEVPNMKYPITPPIKTLSIQKDFGTMDVKDICQIDLLSDSIYFDTIVDTTVQHGTITDVSPDTIYPFTPINGTLTIDCEGLSAENKAVMRRRFTRAEYSHITLRNC